MLINHLLGDRVEIERSLVREISECTGGRIQQLRVEVDGNRVAVHGQTPWYYVKQLAIQAILGYVGEPESLQLEVDIDIVNRGPGGERNRGQQVEH
jgi:hypothetical protein